jgi:hypothetical protein
MKSRERILLLGFLSLAGIFLTGAVATQITSYSDGSVLTASQLNSEFGNLYSTINALDNANIASGANISPAKIDAAIAGDGIARNGSTGVLEVNDDNSTLQISGDILSIKDLGVTLAKMAADSVNSSKIVDGAIVNADISASAAIDRSKLGAVGQQVSSSSNTFSHTTVGAPFVDVTNLTVTITTTGRPVMIGMMPGGTSSSNNGYVSFTRTGGGNSAAAQLCFNRGGSCVEYHGIGGTATNASSSLNYRYPCSSFTMIDTPAAGTYTYKMQGQFTTGPGELEVRYCKLYAYEL